MKRGLHVHHFKLMADGEVADTGTPLQCRQSKWWVLLKNACGLKLLYAFTG